jgi:hypothetical protein
MSFPPQCRARDSLDITNSWYALIYHDFLPAGLDAIQAGARRPE